MEIISHMFKTLLKIWKEDNLLNAAMEAATNMFAENYKLVESALNSLFNNEEFTIDVYKGDRRINYFEKDIRKKILEHLSINPKEDVAASLVLLGVVRDIERIGDYVKNYYELSKIYNKKFAGRYVERLKAAKDDFLRHFTLGEKAFIEGDAEIADKVVDWYHKEFDNTIITIIKEIMEDDKIKAKDAVAYVLLSRYLKRSAAHLANVASSVCNPFHKIGFITKDNKEVEVK